MGSKDQRADLKFTDEELAELEASLASRSSNSPQFVVGDGLREMPTGPESGEIEIAATKKRADETDLDARPRSGTLPMMPAVRAGTIPPATVEGEGQDTATPSEQMSEVVASEDEDTRRLKRRSAPLDVEAVLSEASEAVTGAGESDKPHARLDHEDGGETTLVSPKPTSDAEEDAEEQATVVILAEAPAPSGQEHGSDAGGHQSEKGGPASGGVPGRSEMSTAPPAASLPEVPQAMSTPIGGEEGDEDRAARVSILLGALRAAGTRTDPDTPGTGEGPARGQEGARGASPFPLASDLTEAPTEKVGKAASDGPLRRRNSAHELSGEDLEEVAEPPPPPPEGRSGAEGESAVDRKRKAWFEELFDEDYLSTVPFVTPNLTRREVDFIEDSLQPTEASELLDLGCATGRHSIELAARGYRVTGLDLSLPFLMRGTDESQRRGLKVNFVHRDFRELSSYEQYDAAFCYGTTFGLFDDESNRKMILAIANALKIGGRFLLEVVNRDYVVPTLPARVGWEGADCVVLEEVDFNFFTSRLVINRSVVFKDGRHQQYEISIRSYALHELGKLMHHAGFRVLEVSGHISHRGQFFGQNSRNLLVLAERKRRT